MHECISVVINTCSDFFLKEKQRKSLKTVGKSQLTQANRKHSQQRIGKDSENASKQKKN